MWTCKDRNQNEYIRGRKKKKIKPLKWFGHLKGRLKSAPIGCIERYEFKEPREYRP